MTDTVDKKTRSKIMSSIRSKGNISTELKMRMLMVRNGINGWKMHPGGIAGNPDFVFPKIQLAVFVDGCFWHGCPKCGHLPKSNVKYWQKKLIKNIERDKKQRAKLRRQGWSVIRIWEHQLSPPDSALNKLQMTLQKLGISK